MFYLSPGVYVREIDLTTTIGAVATSVGVIVLRNTYKGPEHDIQYVTNETQLVEAFGEPTNLSFQDILSASGYLKYGQSLYCTRVMPDDATFAGLKIMEGDTDYAASTEATSAYTFDFTGSNLTYDHVALGLYDLSTFAEEYDSSLDSDELLRLLARSRGAHGNNIRVLVVDRGVYLGIKYLNISDEDNPVLNLPADYNTTDDVNSEASAEAIAIYEAYRDSNDTSFAVIRELQTTLSSNKQFIIFIQAKDQGTDVWENKEQFIVSSDERDTNDQNETMFVETVINEKSKYVWAVLNSTNKTTSVSDGGAIKVSTSTFVELAGGYNGTFGNNAASAQLEEDAAVINALGLYKNPEEIDVNLFIESNKSVTIKNEMISICKDHRKDCMCILDTPKSYNINNRGSESYDLVTWRKGQDSYSFNPNNSYSSTYANWIEVFDKWNKKYRWISPSGHVAGIYAHTDQVTDPWFAPAGLNRSILTGVRRLAWNPTLGERDLLYQNGLNPIVSFSGQGKVIWGQKTLLDKESAFNRVNVRRLFLVLEKAISKSSKYFLFEPNDRTTWTLLTNMITPFLRDVQGRRGIYDFRVQIDDITNTPERIDRNELWGNIWIKPTKTAEFIILNFIATKTGASFDELISSGVV